MNEDPGKCKVRTQTRISTELLKQNQAGGVEAEDSLRRLMSFITNCLLPSWCYSYGT